MQSSRLKSGLRATMLPSDQSFATAGSAMDARTEETQLGLAHEHAPAPVDHATVRAIMAGIMLAMFLSALEQTIVAPALPAIGREPRRHREPVLGGDGVSAGGDRGDAVVRQALRHPWPARASCCSASAFSSPVRWPARWRRRCGARSSRARCRASAAAASCRSRRPSSPTSSRRASARASRATPR